MPGCFSSSNHHLDGVSGQGIEKHGKKESKEDPEQALEDGPLVVSPNDVAHGPHRIQEPQERPIWTTVWLSGEGMHLWVSLFMLGSKLSDEAGLAGVSGSHLGCVTCITDTYVGFSRALGSSRPRPAGVFSASSLVIRMSSASTLPCNKARFDDRWVTG